MLDLPELYKEKVPKWLRTTVETIVIFGTVIIGTNIIIYLFLQLIVNLNDVSGVA